MADQEKIIEDDAREKLLFFYLVIMRANIFSSIDAPTFSLNSAFGLFSALYFFSC